MPIVLQKANTEIEILHPLKKGVSHYVFSTIVTDQTNLKRLKENRFIRDVEIIYLGQLRSNSVFQLMCTAIDFSGDTLQDAPLLRQINYVFDEIVVFVNEQGTIVQLNNHNEILKRWQSTKIKLQKITEGRTILNYFNTMDILIGNTEKLIAFLSSKNMYGLYFNGYWGKHDNLKPRINKVNEQLNEKVEVFEFDRKELGVELRVNPQDSIDLYGGRFYYQDHQLLEADFELNEINNHIKYKVLCLGLRKS